MASLPCVGRPRLYDLVLFNDEAPADKRAAARTEAAGLCARCPSPCPDRVTADTEPRPLVLLPDDWMPPVTEGGAKQEHGTTAGWQRHRRYGTPICDACREARRKYFDEWVASNADRMKGYQAAYYQRNAEKRRAYSRAYRAAHRDEINARRRKQAA